MATITKSIGTSSRDYSTITAWEADLDNTGIYTSGDDAVGECYNDAAFDEIITINGGGTVGLNSVKLSVASGERHDGTEGSGARVVRTSGYCLYINTPDGFNQKYTVEWLEIDGNGNNGQLITGDGQVYTRVGIIKNVIAHGSSGGGSFEGILVSGNRSLSVYNSLFYDNTRDSGLYCRGVVIDFDRTEAAFCNNVIYGISNPNATGPCTGIILNAPVSGSVAKNNIIMNVTTGGTGAAIACDSTSNSGWDYNMSDDDTADDPGGSNNLINKSNSTQFVSTVSGSEDFHIVSTSDAVGAGEDLATTSVDINGSDRNALAATVWDIGAHQYASTASIGTSSRDYSTITLWEADLDDTTIYGAGANAVGECYNDSTFTAGANINGGTTVGLSSVTLSVAEGERHDGTLSAGVFINPTYSIGSAGLVGTVRSNTTIEWLTCEVNGTSSYAHTAIILHDIYSSNTLSRNMVLKGENKVYPSQTPVGIRSGGHENIAHNNIIYGIANGSTGAGIQDSYRRCNALSNTIYGCNYGYQATAQGSDARNVKNNLSIGNNSDFYAAGTGGYVSSNNASSDSTATALGGSNHVTGAPASRQFVSTLSGSEDLHLIFKSAAIDAGVDLGAASGVQYDINGKDRDTENSIWDIGAHEYGDNVVFGLLRV